MEYTMSMYRSKDDMLDAMRAEITQLRAELAAERELADRLYTAIDSAEFNYEKRDTEDARMMDDAVALYATRRNK